MPFNNLINHLSLQAEHISEQDALRFLDLRRYFKVDDETRSLGLAIIGHYKILIKGGNSLISYSVSPICSPLFIRLSLNLQ